MANHHKPTKEELQQGMKESLEKLEKLPKPDPNNPDSKKGNPTPSPSAAPSPSPSHAAPSASPSPSKAAPSASPSTSPSQPSASPSPSEPDEDEKERLRKKAAASSREAQLLHQKNKKYNEALTEAENLKPPTEQEMEAEYGKDEWEDMSEGSKQLARNAWLSNKRFEIMSKASKEGRDVQEWTEKVDKFLADPKNLNKYPELEGKQEDFKLFTMKESRRGLDFEDLVLAFNGEIAKNPPKKNKGKMFEQGNGGGKQKPQPKDDKLSAAQGRALMKTDYKKWKQLLKAGKIKNE